MAPPRVSLLLLLFLLFPAAGNAAAAAAPGGGKGQQQQQAAGFNVTEILGRHKELTLFNYLLTKTRVAHEVNKRGTVTLLAPVNADVDWLLRRSARMARSALVELLSVHVVLDYIDASKLAAMPRGVPTVATTLFQAAGTARDRSGFLTITNMGSGAGGGGVVFASAAAGALVNATFTRAVTARPYNVSVLQISNFVVPPGVVTRPRSPLPSTPPPRLRSMSIPPPSPAPLPTPTPTTSMLPPPTSLPDEEEIGLDEIPSVAPAPSRGHALAPPVTSWWSGIGAAMGLAVSSIILWSL